MVQEYKEQADKAKYLYKTGHITREQAKAQIQPYIDYFNKRSKEIAKKYNQRPKLINFAGYTR